MSGKESKTFLTFTIVDFLTLVPSSNNFLKDLNVLSPLSVIFKYLLISSTECLSIINSRSSLLTPTRLIVVIVQQIAA